MERTTSQEVMDRVSGYFVTSAAGYIIEYIDRTDILKEGANVQALTEVLLRALNEYRSVDFEDFITNNQLDRMPMLARSLSIREKILGPPAIRQRDFVKD